MEVDQMDTYNQETSEPGVAVHPRTTPYISGNNQILGHPGTLTAVPTSRHFPPTEQLSSWLNTRGQFNQPRQVPHTGGAKRQTGVPCDRGWFAHLMKSWLTQTGRNASEIPNIKIGGAERPLDLLVLYNKVQGLGGLEAVQQTGQWRLIALMIGYIPPKHDVTPWEEIANTLSRTYIAFLVPFEEFCSKLRTTGRQPADQLRQIAEWPILPFSHEELAHAKVFVDHTRREIAKTLQYRRFEIPQVERARMDQAITEAWHMAKEFDEIVLYHFIVFSNSSQTCDLMQQAAVLHEQYRILSIGQHIYIMTQRDVIDIRNTLRLGIDHLKTEYTRKVRGHQKTGLDLHGPWGDPDSHGQLMEQPLQLSEEQQEQALTTLLNSYKELNTNERYAIERQPPMQPLVGRRCPSLTDELELPNQPWHLYPISIPENSNLAVNTQPESMVFPVVPAIYHPPNQGQVNSVEKSMLRLGIQSFANEISDKSYRATQNVRSHEMTSSEMFECLVDHGCVDLRLAIDSRQFSTCRVAEGGFGDIWKGRFYDGTGIAVKVWRFGLVSEDERKSLKRAMREIYNWSKLNHENVHKLLGVTIFQDRLGMVSNWMEHGNLRRYLAQNNDVNRYQLVHGDLKACNILVSADGVPKLTDFDHSVIAGCSLLFSETTRKGGGTLRWMAPELVLDEGTQERNKKTDIYALGMTFLETMTNADPYSECERDVLIFGKFFRKEHPKRPTEHFPECVPGNRMWGLLVECWNHDPVSRPGADDVLTSINGVLEP